MKHDDASKIKQAATVHGCGVSQEKGRGKDADRNVRETARRLREEASEEKTDQIIWVEPPHPEEELLRIWEELHNSK